MSHGKADVVAEAKSAVHDAGDDVHNILTNRDGAHVAIEHASEHIENVVDKVDTIAKLGNSKGVTKVVPRAVHVLTGDKNGHIKGDVLGLSQLLGDCGNNELVHGVRIDQQGGVHIAPQNVVNGLTGGRSGNDNEETININLISDGSVVANVNAAADGSSAVAVVSAAAVDGALRDTATANADAVAVDA